MNTERLLKHAVQEKLAITICINKVCVFKGAHSLTKDPSLCVYGFLVYDMLLCRLIDSYWNLNYHLLMLIINSNILWMK